MPWREFGLLTAVIVLAAALRLYRLDALPPGLYHDEAYNGLDALALLEGKSRPLFHEVWEQVAFADQVEDLPHGRFPVFFVGNYGREPLFFYLLALSLAVVGVRPLAVRLVPALTGVLVVPAVYWLAREIVTDDDPGRSRRVALLAALNIALWYWPVHFSRFGIRPMLLPLVAALTFASLLRGLRTGSRLAWAAGGFWLGLSFYTYTPARMLPLAVLGWLAIVGWAERGFLRRRWREWPTFAIVAAVVAAPLVIFFLRHPEWAWFRTQYIATDAVGVEVESLSEMLVGNVGLILKGFFLVGEKHLRHNLPGRPMLDPVQAVWVLLGLALAVHQIIACFTHHATRETREVVRATCYVLLLLWLPVMLLPTYLTSDAPHFGRAIGITPAVAVLMALGMDGLWHWVRRSRALTWAMGLMLAVGLLYTGVRTAGDYFVDWAGHPDLEAAFQVDFVALGECARSLPADEGVYMTPPTEEYATILFTLGGPENDRVKSFASAAGVLPAGQEGHAVSYLIRPDDEAALPLLQRWLPQGAIGHDRPHFTAYRVPATFPRVEPSTSLAANWADKIALLGYDLAAASFHPGEKVAVTVYWRALAEIDLPYTFFVHLLGPYNPATNGPVWGQHDAQPGDGTYPTTSWDTDEIVVDEYIVPIPADAPLGNYELEIGFYYLPTMERLPVLDETGQPIDDRVLLGQVSVME
jgi:4-amino-4-deoxy-L-arabinose transferase-like glycosyltransferase